METNMQIGTKLLIELKASLNNPSVLSTERGELFLSERFFGAIQLKVSPAEYLRFINQLSDDVQPKIMSLIFITGEGFNVAIRAPLEIRDGKTFCGEREVTFL